jgi:ABC-2 type transport system ATP-binding protein
MTAPTTDTAIDPPPGAPDGVSSCEAASGETAPVAPIAASPTTPATPAKAPAISTRNLTKRYGALTALDNLTLELEPGDVFGFIGPNGAGKSTTMKILAGLLEPTGGDAAVLGRRVAGNGDFVRRNIGYMPDFIGVYEDLTVSEYLEFFASAYGVPRRERKPIVEQVLELTDLKYKRDAFVDSLSRGMTQRLSLARVLVHDPPVLLLDEPASGLDPRARIEMRELLKELQRLGKTILVSSHILSELGEFCNKLGIIERGKLLVSGTIDDLMARARAHPVIAVQVLDEPELAVAALKSDPRVDQVEPRNGQLLVTLRDPGLHHHFLVERLVARNIRVHSVTPEQLKLEDVFLRLTKGIVQ